MHHFIVSDTDGFAGKDLDVNLNIYKKISHERRLYIIIN